VQAKLELRDGDGKVLAGIEVQESDDVDEVHAIGQWQTADDHVFTHVVDVDTNHLVSLDPILATAVSMFVIARVHAAGNPDREKAFTDTIERALWEPTR
jgi:hypothetical protein